MSEGPQQSRSGENRSRQSQLEQSRKSMRSRVSREGLNPGGVPVDLTPMVEGARQRIGRRGIWIVALLAAAGVVFSLLRPQPEPLPVAGKPVATLELTSGSVAIWPEGGLGTGEALRSLQAGAEVPMGAIVETGPGDSTAALRLEGGGSMRLDGETRLHLSSSSAVVLDRGAVYFDSAGREDRAVEVRTSVGIVRDIGTQFEVRLVKGDGEADTLQVRVREGRIVLRHGRESHEAGLGEQLTLNADGSLDRQAIDVYGSQWDWVVRAAPVPEVEGQPLQTFLVWLAREGGWTLQFSNPQLAREAPEIILHGDVRDLSALEAAELVLGTSQLQFRVADHVLVIEPLEAP